MDKIEKIKKKIKILLNNWKYGSSTEAKYKYEAYKELLEDINSLREEPISDDLKEAAITAADDDMLRRQIMEESNEKRQLYSRIFRRGFRAGVNWHKEMIIKDAVGGYVIEDIKEGNGDFLLSADYLPASMGLKDRQKVKVIVLKDE